MAFLQPESGRRTRVAPPHLRDGGSTAEAGYSNDAGKAAAVMHGDASSFVRRIAGLLSIVLVVPWASARAQTVAGQEGLLPVTEAFALQAERVGPDRVRLDWRIADAYYLYKGRIRVEWLQGERRIDAIALPAGEPKHDENFGEVEVYRSRLQAEVALAPVSAAAGAGTDETRLRVVVQGCHEVEPLVCYPPHATTLVLDAGGVRALTGRTLPPAASAAVSGGADPVDGASGPGAGDGAAAKATATTGADAITPIAPGVAGASDAAPAAPGGLQLAGLLLFALLGGVLLNLMPCVLPVLSLKVLSLADAGADRRQARHRALAYTAGVLASFVLLGGLALAARRAGIGLGWGFQLQQPVVVAVLAYVILAFALSLSGVVLFATRLGGVGHGLASRGGLAGDFFTGILAVVVASPCTAPFMGVALAAAFALSGTVALLVFLALGLGLALPFLLVGWVPALSARLPRPGAWMETLKQALAFPLYATVAWLAWVLSRQHGSDALAFLFAGLLLLALALWASERLRYARPFWRPAALSLSLLALWPLWWIHQLPAPASAAARVAEDGSVPFSPQRLAQLRSDRHAVFVNMTADWCVTCKANERRLLGTDDFRAALARRDAVYMKGDWTRTDPLITRFLEQHGAVGVPLYVVFRPDGGAVVLPTVPTQSQVEAALQGDRS